MTQLRDREQYTLDMGVFLFQGGVSAIRRGIERPSQSRVPRGVSGSTAVPTRKQRERDERQRVTADVVSHIERSEAELSDVIRRYAVVMYYTVKTTGSVRMCVNTPRFGQVSACSVSIDATRMTNLRVPRVSLCGAVHLGTARRH